MKPDLYTKIVLTVIALCLVVIALRSTPPVRAWPNVQQVDIVAINGEPVYRATLNVKISK